MTVEAKADGHKVSPALLHNNYVGEHGIRKPYRKRTGGIIINGIKINSPRYVNDTVVSSCIGGRVRQSFERAEEISSDADSHKTKTKNTKIID